MFKKTTFLAILTVVMFYSCQTNDLGSLQTKAYNFTVTSIDLTGVSSRDSETACYSTPLIAGQNYEAGRIDVEIVNEDGTNFVYITYVTNPDWVIKLTHLYAGDKEGIPETSKGNPKVGVFEKEMDFEANVISDFEVEYKIPADAFEECFYIAAHAEVIKIDNKGNEIKRETAWGQGERFEETESEGTKSEGTKSEGTESKETESEETKSEETESEETKSEETESEETESEGAESEGNSWAMYFQFCKSSCEPVGNSGTGGNPTGGNPTGGNPTGGNPTGGVK